MDSGIVKREPAAMQAFDAVPVQQILRQEVAVKELMSNCMQDNVHYGKIPGCGKKPTLLQPGAQKLTMMFGMADTYDVKQTDFPNGHREYRATCKLIAKSNGMTQGEGVGLCTTMEKKYRYRNVADFQVTGEPIPADSKERKKEYRKQGYGMKMVDGSWEWVKYNDSAQQENPDIADTYNTVLKMACKRALVAAVLNTLAVSDVFTQDVEDLGQYSIDYQQEPNRTPETDRNQKPSNQKPDTLAKLRGLMHEAKLMGVSVEGLMQWVQATYGRGPEELNPYEVEKAEEHVSGVIKDARYLAERKAQAEASAGVYESPEDIEF
jgi:hypothetical protein